MRELLTHGGMTALTSAASIVVLFLLTKLMGSKQVSQMTMFDYVVGITIGSSAAELATELEAPVRPLVAMVVYGAAAVLISLVTSKSIRARSIFTGKPLVLLEDGVIYRKNLEKARLDLSEFLTYCRIGGWFDLNQLHAGGSGPEPPAVPGPGALRHGRPPAGGECAPCRQGGVLGPAGAAAPGLPG